MESVQEYYDIRPLRIYQLQRVAVKGKRNSFFTCIGVWLLQLLLIFKDSEKGNDLADKMRNAPVVGNNQKMYTELINKLIEKAFSIEFMEKLRKNNRDMLELIDKTVRIMISGITENLKFVNSSKYRIQIFEDYEEILKLCEYFDIQLVINTENEWTCVVGNIQNESHLIFIHREQDLTQDFTCEVYSLLYPQEILNVLQGTAVFTYNFPFISAYSLTDTEIVIESLCKINLKPGQTDALMIMFNHLIKLVYQNPLLFTAYMNLKAKSGLALFEICYICERFLLKSEFKIGCLSHEHLKICDKHLETSQCPHCFRKFSEKECEKTLVHCMQCNSFCNKQLKTCKNNCYICRNCLFPEKCMNCEKKITKKCDHINKLQGCKLASCIICLDCIVEDRCPYCGEQVLIICTTCGYPITSEVHVYSSCMHFSHESCKKPYCPSCYF